MVKQLALPFQKERGNGAPMVLRADVDWMIGLLRRRGWQTARELGAQHESDKRILRAIAEASEGEIISGQKGYKLTREATITEIDETIWLKNQGRKMVNRWLAIQRIRHGRKEAA